MEQQQAARFTGMQVLGIIAGVIVLTVVVTFFVIRSLLYPPPFKPVTLSPREEQQLEMKLERFASLGGTAQASPAPADRDAAKPSSLPAPTSGLEPEAYSEEGASRDIRLTERELNAIIAKNTDLASKLAVDLAENLVSVKMIIPVDPDFPMLGGKTLKVKAGAELAYRDNRPVVKLRGVSIMGVPVPNAWLGGLKNIDLVQEFGTSEGFWKTFSEGVESISIKEGQLAVTLKE